MTGILLISLCSNQLNAAEVKIYGAGGVPATLQDEGGSLKICPEQSNQLCASVVIEGGEIKEIIIPGNQQQPPANKSANNLTEVILANYKLKFYYKGRFIDGVMYGKDLLINRTSIN